MAITIGVPNPGKFCYTGRMTLTLPGIRALPRIGYGNFRNVYRDGAVVYKVEYGEGVDLNCNINEHNNAAVLRTRVLPASVVVPPCDLYRVDGEPIVVMPYIPGKPVGECFCLPHEPHTDACMPRDLVLELASHGVDCAYGNIIFHRGSYFLVDLDADLV